MVGGYAHISGGSFSAARRKRSTRLCGGSRWCLEGDGIIGHWLDTTRLCGSGQLCRTDDTARIRGSMRKEGCPGASHCN